MVVWYATARYGHPFTVAAAGVSLPVGALCIVYFVIPGGYVPLPGVVNYRDVSDLVYRFGDTWAFGVAMLAMVVLGVPWLAGLAVRFNARARSSVASQEVAEARRRRRCVNVSRPRRSPDCATTRRGWHATCTTSSATRWR